eukprot:3635451-Rhodomonas_salina.6
MPFGLHERVNVRYRTKTVFPERTSVLGVQMSELHTALKYTLSRRARYLGCTSSTAAYLKPHGPALIEPEVLPLSPQAMMSAPHVARHARSTIAPCVMSVLHIAEHTRSKTSPDTVFVPGHRVSAYQQTP